MLSDKRGRTSWEAEYFKCSASEDLSTHVPLAQCFRAVVMPARRRIGVCHVMFALSLLTHAFFFGVKMRMPSARVQRATDKLIKCFVDAFWT
eukprot:9182752-Pyramimonas_sp.AAC.1